jgi:hypothetical protein
VPRLSTPPPTSRHSDGAARAAGDQYEIVDVSALAINLVADTDYLTYHITAAGTSAADLVVEPRVA